VQLGGAGKGMAEGDLGLVPGTTAVGSELTPDPSGGICATGLAQGLASPIAGMVQSRSAGQQLSHGEARTAPHWAGGCEQGWGARRDPAWRGGTSGKAHGTAGYAGAQHDAREVLWEAVCGTVLLLLAQGLH